MADHEESKVESMMEKITDKIRGHDSSSSDFDDDKSAPSSLKSNIYRLFGREKLVYKVLGGGKCFILLHTLPVLYEKYEDKVDAFAEFNKHYLVFEEKVLSKIPRGPLKDKKTA